MHTFQKWDYNKFIHPLQPVHTAIMLICLRVLILFLLSSYTLIVSGTIANLDILLNSLGSNTTHAHVENAFSGTSDSESRLSKILEINEENQQLIISALNNTIKLSSPNVFNIKNIFKLYQAGRDPSFFLRLFLLGSFSEDFYKVLTFDNIQDILEMLDNYTSLIPDNINLPIMGENPPNPAMCYAASNFMAYVLRERLGEVSKDIKFKNSDILTNKFPFSSIYSIQKNELDIIANIPLRSQRCGITPIRRLFFANNTSLWTSFNTKDSLSAFGTYFTRLLETDSISSAFSKIYKALNESYSSTTIRLPNLPTDHFLDWIKSYSKSTQPLLLLFVQCLLDKLDISTTKSPLIRSLSNFINFPDIPIDNDERELFLLYICLLEHCGIASIKGNFFETLSPTDQDKFIHQVYKQFDGNLTGDFGSSMPCQYWTSVLLYSKLPISMLKRIDKKIFLHCMINHTMINCYDLMRLTHKDTLKRLRDEKVIFGSQDNAYNSSSESMFNILSLYDLGNSKSSTVKRMIEKAYQSYHGTTAPSTFDAYCVSEMKSFFSEFLPKVDYETTFKNALNESYKALDIFVKGGNDIQETIYNRVVFDDIIKVCEQARDKYNGSTNGFHDFACKDPNYCNEKNGLRLDSITDNDMTLIRDMLISPIDNVMYDCLLKIWRRDCTYRHPINGTKISTFGNGPTNDCSILASSYYFIYISIALFLFA